MSGKSAYLESLLLDHLFLEAPFQSPCQWWLELLSSTELTFPVSTNSELTPLRVVAPRVQVSKWSKVAPVVVEGNVQHGYVYNTQEIILPQPESGLWQVTHVAIWSQSTDGDLLYWSSLESFLAVSSEEPKSILPGDLIIMEL